MILKLKDKKVFVEVQDNKLIVECSKDITRSEFLNLDFPNADQTNILTRDELQHAINDLQGRIDILEELKTSHEIKLAIHRYKENECDIIIHQNMTCPF